MDRYLKRIPSWGKIVPVFAVIVLIVYAWTIIWFFWKLPSWLFFLNAGEILTAFAYSLATNLAESLVVLCAPLLLALAACPHSEAALHADEAEIAVPDARSRYPCISDCLYEGVGDKRYSPLQLAGLAGMTDLSSHPEKARKDQARE